MQCYRFAHCDGEESHCMSTTHSHIAHLEHSVVLWLQETFATPCLCLGFSGLHHLLAAMEHAMRSGQVVGQGAVSQLLFLLESCPCRVLSMILESVNEMGRVSFSGDNLGSKKTHHSVQGRSTKSETWIPRVKITVTHGAPDEAPRTPAQIDIQVFPPHTRQERSCEREREERASERLQSASSVRSS